LDAALVALSGRVRVREGSSRTSEDIITELWNEVFNPAPVGESGKANAPAGATR
jgi:MoxR-like ATPase